MPEAIRATVRWNTGSARTSSSPSSVVYQMEPNSTVGRNRCGRSTGMRLCTVALQVDLDQILQGRVEAADDCSPVTKLHAVWPAIDSLGLPVAGSKLTSEFAGTAADAT